MEQNTHMSISPLLVGKMIEIGQDGASASLTATKDMAADERGLVHGGFTFGLADFAAMLAVNDPNVVLGGANTRFLAPVSVGQEMVAKASIESTKGRKRVVKVAVSVGDKVVMDGELTCFVLDQHVLGPE